jgi:predicted  nucleic acid-binding Zn-ribbon protein
VKADPEAQRRLLDLQAIDTALAQLAHRRGSLPEFAELDRLARELSTMEDERVRAQVAVDDLDRDISRFERDIEQVRARKDKDQQRLDSGSGHLRERTEQQRDETLATIAKEEEFRLAGRKPLAADLPADLLALYDKIRESSGGIGAALLRQGRCEGCRIELAGNERATVRNSPADEVLRHEECRRILVRTAESGL